MEANKSKIQTKQTEARTGKRVDGQKSAAEPRGNHLCTLKTNRRALACAANGNNPKTFPFSFQAAQLHTKAVSKSNSIYWTKHFEISSRYVYFGQCISHRTKLNFIHGALDQSITSQQEQTALRFTTNACYVHDAFSVKQNRRMKTEGSKN